MRDQGSPAPNKGQRPLSPEPGRQLAAVLLQPSASGLIAGQSSFCPDPNENALLVGIGNGFGLEPGNPKKAQPGAPGEQAVDMSIVLNSDATRVPQQVGEVHCIHSVFMVWVCGPFQVSQSAVWTVMAAMVCVSPNPPKV